MRLGVIGLTTCPKLSKPLAVYKGYFHRAQLRVAALLPRVFPAFAAENAAVGERLLWVLARQIIKEFFMKKGVYLLVLVLAAASVFLWLKREKLPLYLSVDTPPAPALTPQQALDSFSLAPGFAIELVAAEPLVVDPVAMAWDEAGRLFVVEMRGFMPNAYGDGEDQPVGRVVMLLDDNGDGVMDRSEVFLDGLVMPRAVAVVNEGLLVAEPPTLWLCPNIHGKTRCENRRKVADYATNYESVSMEHLENGLMLGLDNWIYNSKSDRRFRFVDGELVVEPTLSRGQWGISQDNQGRRYYNTNSNFLSGDYFSAHSFSGASRGLGEQITDNDEVFSIRVNPGVNRAYLDGVLRDDGRLKSPTAVSGLAVYRGGQFPQSYWQDIFVPEPAANAVVQLRANLDSFEVSAEHITYADKRWGQREFLASTDERFRPVDMKVGPDGALYVIDMYRGIIQHKEFLTEELLAQILERGLDTPLGQGRIWRIVSTESPRLAAPQIAGASSEQLLDLLGSDVPWLRETAQRLLAARSDARDGLRQLVGKGGELAAVHALWALEAQGALDAATVATALARNTPALTRQLLLAAGPHMDRDTLLAVGDEALGDTAAALAWFDALKRFNGDAEVQRRLLAMLLSHGGDVYRREAAVRSSAGVEQEMLAAVLASDSLSPENGGAALLKALTNSAYQTAVADVAAAQQALPALLARIAALQDEKQWQQLAMLAGLASAAEKQDTPFSLAQAPALFVDKTLSGDDPLWDARLAARRAFTWPGDELASGREPLTGEQQALLAKGEKFYQHCANCHGKEGQGVPGLAPELAGSEWVTGPVEWLTRIVLDGMQGEIIVNGKTWNGVMPAHRHFPGLDADTLTGLLIHMRRLGPNRAAAPSVEQVSEIMALPANPNPWTAQAIRQVPYASPLDKFVGQYKISFVKFTFAVDEGELTVQAPMYGRSRLTQISETRFSSAQDGEELEFRFELDKRGEVSALYIVRGGQENRVEKVQ